MIAALLTMLLLGGSSGIAGFLYDPGDVKKEIKTVVTDPQRQSAAIEVVKEQKKHSKKYGKAVKAMGKKLDDVLDDRSISQADLATIFDGFIQEVKIYNDDWIDTQFELRDQLTKEEWSAVFSVVDKG
jgi:hypothetical protein